jgi:hypothetical protein
MLGRTCCSAIGEYVEETQTGREGGGRDGRRRRLDRNVYTQHRMEEKGIRDRNGREERG